MFPRYAIYYVAAPGSDLDRFGARLLGYDAFSGEELPFPKGVTEIVSDWSDLTRDPRQYGFHATLKAPFSLARGKTEAALVAACETFANRPRPLPVIRPVVNSISDFVAIVLRTRRPNLNGWPQSVQVNSIYFARRSQRKIARGEILSN